MPGELLDTNVLVYAFTTDPRAAAAQALLERGCLASVQGLNEFTNVARCGLGMTWREVHDALSAIRTVCRAILPINVETHESALRIAERHGLSFFDALMISAALRAGCDTLWSEDMQDGMAIDGRLRIVNPFRESQRRENRLDACGALRDQLVSGTTAASGARPAPPRAPRARSPAE